jgi:hypothetical protein
LRHLLFVTYNIERKYGRRGPIYDWEMFQSDPGLITSRVLASVGLRSKEGEIRREKKRKPRNRHRFPGRPEKIIPITENKEVLAKAARNETASDRRWAQILESERLKEAGIYDPALSIEEVGYIVTVPEDYYPQASALTRSNAVRQPRSEGPRYVAPALRAKPKEGDICNECLCKYKWYRTGVLVGREALLNASDYARCWADVESGGFTATRLKDKWGGLATEHRQRRAQHLYEQNHTLLCACDPNAEDDMDWSEFNIPGGLNFEY